MFVSQHLLNQKSASVFDEKNPGHFIYVDTDETVKLHSKDGAPNNVLIGYLRRLRQLHPDYTFVLWSRAGQDHAREVAEEFDLLDLFDYILAKPSWLFDDAGDAWDKHVKVLSPEEDFLLGDNHSSIEEYIEDHSTPDKLPIVFE